MSPLYTDTRRRQPRNPRKHRKPTFAAFPNAPYRRKATVRRTRDNGTMPCGCFCANARSSLVPGRWWGEVGPRRKKIDRKKTMVSVFRKKIGGKDGVSPSLTNELKITQPENALLLRIWENLEFVHHEDPLFARAAKRRGDRLLDFCSDTRPHF